MSLVQCANLPARGSKDIMMESIFAWEGLLCFRFERAEKRYGFRISGKLSWKSQLRKLETFS